MSTLVTGGNGFFGVNLVKGLTKHGQKVVSFNRSATPDVVRDYLAPHLDLVTFAQGDVTNLPRLQQVVEDNNVSAIIHTATLTATSLDVERNNAWQIINVNVMGSVNVFEVGRRLGLRRIVYISSGAVYRHGAGTDPHFEDEQPCPEDLYGISKYASEMIVQRYRHLLGTSIASVRLVQPYGPMERKSRSRVVLSPICEWAHQALKGEEIAVEALDSIMDWCYVDDVVDGTLSILLADEPRHDIYNVGSGRSTSVRAVLAAISKCVPGTRYFESPDVIPNPNIDRRIETGYQDITRMREEFGYQPQIDIDTGIKKYIDWLEQNRWDWE